MSIEFMSYSSPFLGGWESGESTLKASGTLQEYKVVGSCLPTPNATLHPSLACGDLHLIMWSPSPSSGTF